MFHHRGFERRCDSQTAISGFQDFNISGFQGLIFHDFQVSIHELRPTAAGYVDLADGCTAGRCPIGGSDDGLLLSNGSGRDALELRTEVELSEGSGTDALV